MKETLQCLVVSLFVVTSSIAAEEWPVIRLWPDSLPNGSRSLDPKRVDTLKAKETSERITYVEQPSLTLYRAPVTKRNGCKRGPCLSIDDVPVAGGYNGSKPNHNLDTLGSDFSKLI
ncbi:MAG: hypothetical protein ACYSWQ_28915 [Planctomycetota bacterium]|jgi:hypothetical protein